MHFAALKMPDQVQNPAKALDALLRDLIDYAGLFPPASLPMARAVENYEQYLRSEWSWTLSRFIVPAARLEEFKEALAGLKPLKSRNGFRNWRLSALLGSDVIEDVAHVRRFNARKAGSKPARRSLIESLEVKAGHPAEIRQVSGIAPAGLKVYFEVPLASCGDCIGEIAKCGRRAKIRTGGETADKFPAPESVVEFIRLCAASNVPFKATAGLHHPLRSAHCFTYQPDSASGIMHGFLNVFLAAAFLRAGMNSNLAVELLEERAPNAIHFDADEVVWRDHRITRGEIAATRRNFAISFGSCSFTEPIEDLRVLHLL